MQRRLCKSNSETKLHLNQRFFVCAFALILLLNCYVVNSEGQSNTKVLENAEVNVNSQNAGNIAEEKLRRQKLAEEEGNKIISELTGKIDEIKNIPKTMTTVKEYKKLMSSHTFPKFDDKKFFSDSNLADLFWNGLIDLDYEGYDHNKINADASKTPDGKLHPLHPSHFTNDETIGVDLGTCTTAASFVNNQTCAVTSIQFFDPKSKNLFSKSIPSTILFKENGDVVVGHEAEEAKLKDPKAVVFNVKRILGLSANDPKFAEEMKHLGGFHVITKGDKAAILPVVNGKVLPAISPVRISAMLLEYVAKMASIQRNTEMRRLLVTFPAYFNSDRRQATRDAAVMAGYSLGSIVCEPTSAATFYMFLDTLINQRHKRKSRNAVDYWLVFDAGAGTVDVSVVLINDKGNIAVRAVTGNSHVAGEYITELLTKDIEKTMKDSPFKHLVPQKNTNEYMMFHSKLNRIANKAKEELTTASSTVVEYQFDEKNVFRTTVTVDHFNTLIQPVLQLYKELILRALKDAKVSSLVSVNGKPKSSVPVVSRVLYIGGTTFIPAVENMVHDVLGCERYKLVDTIGAVAKGAGLSAALLDKLMLRLFSILKFLKRSDVIPLPLGTEVQGGWFSKIVSANVPLPCGGSQTYVTGEDFQTHITIPVYEGTNIVANKNCLIGSVRIENITKKRKGEVSVKVTIMVDREGMIHTKAEELGTNRSVEATFSRYNIGERVHKNLSLEDRAVLKLSEEIQAQMDEAKNISTSIMNNRLAHYGIFCVAFIFNLMLINFSSLYEGSNVALNFFPFLSSLTDREIGFYALTVLFSMMVISHFRDVYDTVKEVNVFSKIDETKVMLNNASDSLKAYALNGYMKLVVEASKFFPSIAKKVEVMARYDALKEKDDYTHNDELQTNAGTTNKRKCRFENELKNVLSVVSPDQKKLMNIAPYSVKLHSMYHALYPFKNDLKNNNPYIHFCLHSAPLLNLLKNEKNGNILG